MMSHQPEDSPPWPWLRGGEAPRFDTDLAPAEVMRLSGREREQRLDLSVGRKLYIGSLGLHLLAGRGRARLRSLHVPALGLWRWADHRAERDGGRHVGAIARWDALSAELGAGRTIEAQVVTLREALAKSEAENRGLRLQVVQLASDLSRRGPSLDKIRR